MGPLRLLLCVLFAAPSAAADPRRASAPATVVAATVAGRHVALLDELEHAENTITAITDQAQHLGSAYRAWLWVTPVLGQGTYGVTFRIDVR